MHMKIFLHASFAWQWGHTWEKLVKDLWVWTELKEHHNGQNMTLWHELFFGQNKYAMVIFKRDIKTHLNELWRLQHKRWIVCGLTEQSLHLSTTMSSLCITRRACLLDRWQDNVAKIPGNMNNRFWPSPAKSWCLPRPKQAPSARMEN